jgi:hypothetical protein
MAIEITLRDMYIEGMDTVILEGKLAEEFPNLTVSQKEKLISRMETVYFKNFYISKVRRVA